MKLVHNLCNIATLALYGALESIRPTSETISALEDGAKNIRDAKKAFKKIKAETTETARVLRNNQKEERKALASKHALEARLLSEQTSNLLAKALEGVSLARQRAIENLERSREIAHNKRGVATLAATAAA